MIMRSAYEAIPSFACRALVASTGPEVPAVAAGLPWPSTGPSFACRAVARPLKITPRVCPACSLSAFQ